MINARYLMMGLLAAAGGFVLLRGPGPHPAVSMQTVRAEMPLRPRASARPKMLLVFVAGAVVHPGLYTLREGARAVDAVARAGGLAPDADPAGVDLAEPLLDGEEIAAPLAGARRTAAAHGIRKPANRSKARRKKTQASVDPIDLNTADAAALSQLPGIGAEMAQRLVSFRQANGDFASLDELADVAGMSQRRIDTVTPYLFVNR